MKIWSHWWNRRGILLSCVSITISLHHVDFNETHGGNTRWQLHKRAACCFEQILEAIPYKTEVDRPLSFHLRIVNKTLLEKYRKTQQSCSLLGSNTITNHSTALCRRNPEDFPRAMTDRDGWFDWLIDWLIESGECSKHCNNWWK